MSEVTMDLTKLRIDWEKLPEDYPMEGICRKRIMGEKAMLSRVQLMAGTIVPVHSHENEQFGLLLSGRMLFTLGDEGEEVELLAGEVIHLPSNLKHGAIAAEDSVILDVFSPPSEKTGIDR